MGQMHLSTTDCIRLAAVPIAPIIVGCAAGMYTNIGPAVAILQGALNVCFTISILDTSDNTVFKTAAAVGFIGASLFAGYLKSDLSSSILVTGACLLAEAAVFKFKVSL